MTIGNYREAARPNAIPDVQTWKAALLESGWGNARHSTAKEFTMSGNRTHQTQANRKKRFDFPQTGKQASQQTWEGGGREPVDPDDVEDDGKYLGQSNSKQQLRSDDN